MTDPNETVEDRESHYGDFASTSEISRRIKAAMKMPSGWSALTDAQREALEMIAVKISRILNGDPNYADSWHDIAGYAMLVEKQLLGEGTEQAADDRKADYFAASSLPGPCPDQSLRKGCLVLCQDDVVRKLASFGIHVHDGFESVRLVPPGNYGGITNHPMSFIRYVTAQPDGA